MTELEYVVKECEDRIRMLTHAVSGGKVTSFDEYKYACGQIRGLEAACLIVTDLKKRLEDSDSE
jgi:hypothetical protein